MSTPRILMTADTLGGVWTYALELARALGEWRVPVSLATMGAPLDASQRAEARAVANLEIFESTFKLEWMEDPWEDVRRAGEWLLELEQRLSPHTVHLNGFAHAALPWRAPVLVVGHSCVVSWWKAVKREEAPAQWAPYRSEVKRGLHAADLVVAPTRAMLDSLKEHYSIAGGRVIPNGRGAQSFRPGVKEPFVLAAGRLWDGAKNVGVLEQIAPRLRWPVYVAGEQRHPEGGRAGFESVRVLGRLSPDELAKYYRTASIYALPARYEPFGLTVLEAALAGCALVLGDIESLRENWNDAAVFVAPDDTGGLAAALNGLMADPDRLARLQLRARTRALQFCPRRMAGRYLDAYRELAAQREVVCA